MDNTKNIFDDLLFSPNIAKITEINACTSGAVLLNIQALPCHTEVEKNIYEVISVLDGRFDIGNIFVEGAYGELDTSWLAKVKDKKLRDEILNSLMDSGKLTGAEYYSVTSGKTNLLRGADDQTLHKENMLRINEVISEQNAIDNFMKKIEDELDQLSDKYYNSENKKLDRIFRNKVKNHDAYYESIYYFAENVKIEMENYNNVYNFVKQLRLKKEINFENVNKELKQLINEFRRTIPYNLYRQIAEKTSNYSDTKMLTLCLARMGEEKLYDITNYPHLTKFIEFMELVNNLNPVALIEEEERLIYEIHSRTSELKEERDFVFLVEFVQYLRNYLSYQVTLDGYHHVNNHINKYFQLCQEYQISCVLSELDNYYKLLTDYHNTNIKRSECMLQNCGILDYPGSSVKGRNFAGYSLHKLVNSMSYINKMLQTAKKIVVLIAGGFHTSTITRELMDRNISYIVIMPNITISTEAASRTFQNLAKLHGKS